MLNGLVIVGHSREIDRPYWAQSGLKLLEHEKKWTGFTGMEHKQTANTGTQRLNGLVLLRHGFQKDWM